MPFGEQSQQEEKAISYERRDLIFVGEEEKKTSGGKVYWRVQDNVGKGRFYSVWEQDLLTRLHSIQSEKGVVPCVVKIEKTGTSTFYGISDCGDAAETIAKASNEKAQASRAPGGKNSEFGRRMHPDDAVRVTALAHEERAIQFIAMILDDRPEGMSREQFAKGKFLPIMSFLSDFTSMPTTQTPDAPAPKTQEAPATQAAAGFGDAPVDTSGDDDIPF